jgi:hypothetical protein
MIISHKHKFIFIAIPKTGTHSFRFALRKQLAEGDDEQVSLLVHKKSSYSEIAGIPHGHIDALTIRQVVGEEIWKSYFKFACVRDPWERFVSFAFFRHKDNKDFQTDPLKVMKGILSTPVTPDRIMVKPQYQFISDEKGDIIIDHICRYEDLQGSYNEVCEKIGIPSEILEKVNESDHSAYAGYYDDKLREMVKRIYEKDIALFGYTFKG